MALVVDEAHKHMSKGVFLRRVSIARVIARESKVLLSLARSLLPANRNQFKFSSHARAVFARRTERESGAMTTDMRLHAIFDARARAPAQVKCAAQF